MIESKRSVINFGLVLLLLLATSIGCQKYKELADKAEYSSVGPHQTAEASGKIFKTEGDPLGGAETYWRVSYQFTLEGKTYEKVKIFGKYVDRSKWVTGKEVSVCYDPTNPADFTVRALLSDTPGTALYPKCPPV
jgi:hypothetical protein